MIKLLTSNTEQRSYKMWVAFGPPKDFGMINVMTSLLSDADVRDKYYMAHKRIPLDVILVEYL